MFVRGGVLLLKMFCWHLMVVDMVPHAYMCQVGAYHIGMMSYMLLVNDDCW
jgi:hypothetical protein